MARRRITKTSQLLTAVVIAIFVLTIAIVGNMFGWFGTTQSVSGGTTTTNYVMTGATGTCPDTKTTSLTIDVKNTANETGSEGFDITGYLYKIVDGEEEYVTSITDTTDPTATSIECGYEYVFKPVSTDGASGDEGHFTKVLSGDARIKDGWLYFTADGAKKNIIVGMDQHATLKCRAYDNNQKALMYDSSDASNSDYETDPVTFTSTTDNTTATDESLGLDIEFECLAVESDTNYNDRGIWVLIDAPTNTWKEPSVYVNGAKLSEASDLMTNYERRAYSDYEYAFLIPESVVVKDGGEGMDVRVVMDLLDGVSSAGADPQIDFAPRASYLSTDGVNVKVGAVKDDSSTTQIYSIYDITVDVT